MTPRGLLRAARELSASALVLVALALWCACWRGPDDDEGVTDGG